MEGRGEGGSQVKNSQNSDGKGWLQGGGEGILRNWMPTALISISVIRVQNTFAANVLKQLACCSILHVVFHCRLPPCTVCTSGSFQYNFLQEYQRRWGWGWLVA